MEWNCLLVVMLIAGLLVDLGLTEAAPATTARKSGKRTPAPTDTVVTEEPVTLQTLMNSQCKLPTRGQTKMCGMRELDLPEDVGNGVVFWRPEVCRALKCQCLATKEVRREKRTVKNNKTMIELRRYRIFECV